MVPELELVQLLSGLKIPLLLSLVDARAMPAILSLVFCYILLLQWGMNQPRVRVMSMMNVRQLMGVVRDHVRALDFFFYCLLTLLLRLYPAFRQHKDLWL